MCNAYVYNSQGRGGDVSRTSDDIGPSGHCRIVAVSYLAYHWTRQTSDHVAVVCDIVKPLSVAR